MWYALDNEQLLSKNSSTKTSTPSEKKKKPQKQQGVGLSCKEDLMGEHTSTD